MAADPFRFHPELRDKITPWEKSYFRGPFLPEFDAMMAARGNPDWRYPDEVREARRREFLSGLGAGDLWVFGYGSLMWDPGFRFAEVRAAHVEGYARRFCLVDNLGGRGTPEAPGLMAALDRGAGCAGLAFRISGELVGEESFYLWQREMVLPAYEAVMVPARTDGGTVTALTFVADHSVDRIRPDLPRETQVQYLATGQGVLGTSQDYIENLADHFAALGIEDEDMSGLLEEVRGYSGQESSRA